MRTPILIAVLAALAPGIAAAQESAWSTAQTVTVQLSNYRFSPASIVLQAGAPYQLHLENTSSKDHSFSAKAFFASATVRPEDQAKIEHGRIDVPGQQAVDVDLVPTRPGEYRLECDHFLHAAFGMKGAIIVR